jgi:hypothetical protein
MEFTFNASALGAGGVIERTSRGRTRTTLVPSLASVALAPSGGEGSSVVVNYDTPERAFLRAETRVAGYRLSKSVFSTYTDVLITGLRILDRLSIALMHATVTSTRDVNDEDDDSSQFTLQATYRGVEVDDLEVAPIVDVELCSFPRYADVAERLLGQNGDLRKRFGIATENDNALLAQRVRSRRAIQGSIVKQVEHGGSLSRVAHKLHVPNFGTARFGELMLKPGRRRVNLLRLAFGVDETRMGDPAPEDEAMVLEAPEDDPSGSMTVGSVEGNGNPVFP